MNKILIIWRRLGKEHGEDCGFRINSTEVIENHINEKINSFSKFSCLNWHWWQVNDQLLIETATTNIDSASQKVFYYLPHKNWVIVKNFQSNSVKSEWKWYIHIGDISFDISRNCWIFTDWFNDTNCEE